MTKHKLPMTQGAALARIAGQLPESWSGMARITDRAVSTVYNWANPGTEESVPFDCAVLLDVAFQQSGGIGAPLFEAYAVQIECERASAFADQAAIAEAAMIAIKENSDAAAAVMRCILPGATATDFADAIRERQEAIAADQNTLALLKAGAGSVERDERVSPGGEA